MNTDNDASLSTNIKTENLDALCEQWLTWSRTRRLYGPRTCLEGTLGRFADSSKRPKHIPVEVESAKLTAFHLAYISQPDALDRKVFELYYVHRIRPIKVAAAALGISRKHFYTVLQSFRARLDAASDAIVKGSDPFDS